MIEIMFIGKGKEVMRNGSKCGNDTRMRIGINTPNTGLNEIIPLIISLGNLDEKIVETGHGINNGKVVNTHIIIIIVLDEEGEYKLWNILGKDAEEEYISTIDTLDTDGLEER